MAVINLTLERSHLEVVTLPNPTRSGKYSLMSRVNSQAVGTQAAAQALRTGGSTRGVLQRLVLLPAPITKTTYWAFFQYRSRTNPTDDSTALNVWDWKSWSTTMERCTYRSTCTLSIQSKLLGGT